MNRASAALVQGMMRIGPRVLPFADAATPELPMAQLLRLSLFQVTVGMAAVLLIGTLNRVMIVELAVPSWIVAGMLSLPLLFAPLRALVGFRSDNHRSVLGWRRVPYIWFGTMAQFGGFAIMPFALLILSGDTTGPLWIGQAAAALAFLLVGAGLHTVQTVGLALATDLAPERARPRVVALLCAMLLAGMAVSALAFRLPARTFQRGAAHPGGAGRRGCHDAVELRRTLEAGAAQSGALGQIFFATALSWTPGAILQPSGKPAGVLSRPRSEPPASVCRIFCWSRMVGKSCISRSARQPHSLRCSRLAEALAWPLPRAS